MKGCLAFLLIDYTYTGGVEKVYATLPSLFLRNGLQADHLISLKSALGKPFMNFSDKIPTMVLFPGKDLPDFRDKLSKFLREKNITTLIFQGDNVSINLKIFDACKKAGCRAILHYHGSPYGYLRKYIYPSDLAKKPLLIFKSLWRKIMFPLKKRRLGKLIALSTGGIVCVSKGIKTEIKNLFNFTEKQSAHLHAIPNPIGYFSSYDSSSAAKEKIVIFAGRLERRHKNAQLVLRAWKTVCSKAPEWKLHILGDGSIKDEMQEYVAENQLSNVVFFGRVEDVAPYLEVAAIAVSTSDFEGLGMAMIEAAAMQCALVSTKSDGGISDFIVQDKTGILVAKNDAEGMAEAILKLIEDDKLRKDLTIAATEKIRDFEEEKIISLWKEIL